ncbi:MAG TPA: MazG-like family protein [Burkholderiales bacterium]|nr:MazG-like family protein [Burkholderiales bacterium]
MIVHDHTETASTISPKRASTIAEIRSVEAAELLEHFQWVSDKDSPTMPPDKLGRIDEDIADVFLYLIRLADMLDVDLIQVADRKIETNAQKYPVEKARGTARKYTEL